MAIPSLRNTARTESYVNVLTDADIDELREQAQQQGEVISRSTEFGIRSNLPQILGTGGSYTIPLRNGLTIDIVNATMYQSFKWMCEHEHSFPLVSKFCLSGSCRVQTPAVTDIDNDYEEVAGCNYLYHLPNLIEFEQWQSNKLIHVVMVYTKVDSFCSFNLGNPSLPKPLQKLIEGNPTQRFHQPLGKTTLQMKQAVQQILNCPYQGLTQQLYLESKALELFALQFACWSETNCASTEQLCLQAGDIDRLHHAKEILLQNSHNPPSLLEIARQVGLNDCKLKQGFRQVFGTTLFGYLYDYRMQQARQLLLNPNLSIASIANQVGYKSPEAFSTAFQRKFAVRPKAYQLGKHHRQAE